MMTRRKRNDTGEFRMLYFSYGSNMSLPRLRARAPSAQSVAIASLPGHVLRFHKVGNDGTGKCDALFTGDQSDYVLGVVFDIAVIDKSRLDQTEGLGYGYAEKQIEVLTDEGRKPVTRMYVAIRIDASLKPYLWYRMHVLAGCREHNFPDEYVRAIEAVKTIPDIDTARCERELGVYHSVTMHTDSQ